MLARVICTLFAALAAYASAANAEGNALHASHLPVRGMIRICGDTQGGLLGLFETAFVKMYPDVGFSNTPSPSQLGVPGMIMGLCDLAITGAPAEPSQLYLLNKMGPRRPVRIAIAGGSYDVRGRSAVLGVYVNRVNPIDKLTIGQLSRVFGAEHNAGWRDYLWDDRDARGPERNIRTWGQLGLGGKWSGRSIHTYGLSWGGPEIFMSQMLTGGSDKWNQNYRTYNIKGFARGSALTSHMIAEMAADPSSIGWTQVIFAQHNPNLKLVAVAASKRGP